MHNVGLEGQSTIIPELKLYHSYIDSNGQMQGIGDPAGDSVVDCLGGLDDMTMQREAWIRVMVESGVRVS